MIVLAVVLVSMLLLVAPHAAAQTEPSITEPPGLNRTLWEQLIFDTYDCPSPECEPPTGEENHDGVDPRLRAYYGYLPPTARRTGR